jgi:hypothetical protein
LSHVRTAPHCASYLPDVGSARHDRKFTRRCSAARLIGSRRLPVPVRNAPLCYSASSRCTSSTCWKQ